ncbi:MAG: O-antigen ligase family protein [Nitrospira sp.]|nr:O-antigen ligase family protein [Nitrospira sp.]MDH4244017.1 O-antigen ligase family protein [Nitrospira sp.]MDH4355889.1 O-antigen ligase family protein [Nitrospira sp.]MDH5317896.1 O-antigen ligase family protein [Nitrospira sp.]
MAAMNNLQRVEVGTVKRRAYETRSYPSAWLEYVWYLSLFYTMLGSAWGIVISSVGGVLWVLVATSCFLSVGSQALRVYKPVALALSTGILMIVIQMVFHQGNQRALTEGIFIVGWLILLITVQPLSLRPGFLQRFALVALAIGVACVPYISLADAGGISRAKASGTGISNGNALGMWFGFCTVYCVFWGLQCQKPILRIAAWTMAVGCFYIVALTVSRAPLLAIILACVVGFRSSLKRSFVPLLSFILLISLVYVSGIFDTEIGYYTARGAEKTGREMLFSRALERILDSPWLGVGLGEIRIYSESGKKFINPHNGLLHIALGAGIVPLICFLGYLSRVVVGALHIMQRVRVGEAALLPPLVAYALFEIPMLDNVFMSPWTVVVFGLVAGAYQSDDLRRLRTVSE